MIDEKLYKGFMLDPHVIYSMGVSRFIDSLMLNILQLYPGILDDVTPIVNLNQEVIHSFLQYKYDFFIDKNCLQCVINDNKFWEQFELFLFKSTRYNMVWFDSDLLNFVFIIYKNQMNKHTEIAYINKDYENGINIYDVNYKYYNTIVLVSSLKYWFLKNVIIYQLENGSSICLK
jgi:hypothetical protein